MTQVLRFRAENKNIFDAIRAGTKKIETRAATPKYKKINKGDKVRFVCGKDSFTKVVGDIELFETVEALTGKYKPQNINPATRTKEELAAMYNSFPNYEEKLKKYGIIAWELK